MSTPTSTIPPPQPQPLPPLHTLIRPAHILSLFRHHQQRKTHYLKGCIKLWSRILIRRPQSREYQQAYQGLVALTATIKDALAKQKEGEARREREQQQVALLDNSRESREREQDAFRILERQVEGRRTAVPGVEEFEAGLSAFGAGGDAAMRALWEGQDEGLARDDVEMALGLLNVDFGVEGRVGMEDLWAGLTLLGLRTSVRVDEFLLEMEREGR